MKKLAQGKFWQRNDFATLFCTLVGTKTNASPVGAGDSIRPWISVFDQGGHKLIDQVRVGAPVSTTLDERQMIGVLDRTGEGTDRLGEQVRVIGHLNL